MEVTFKIIHLRQLPPLLLNIKSKEHLNSVAIVLLLVCLKDLSLGQLTKVIMFKKVIVNMMI
jgi:hypothetical protein